jgi:hypothetical protein
MDSKTFKDRAKRLNEVNVALSKLDPSLREKAFELLVGYVTGCEERPELIKGAHTGDSGSEVENRENFFSKHQGKKPAENAVIAAAYFYSQFGSHPFNSKQIKEIADDAGMTVPDRIDKSFQGAKRKEKALFRNLGEGQFRFTVHGETWIKATYGVKKGNKTPQATEGHAG